MKSTGILRQIDELGRIVLPKELRTNLSLETKDSVEIYVDGDLIVLKKHEPSCVFCGSVKNTVEYKGKIVCQKCIDELSK